MKPSCKRCGKRMYYDRIRDEVHVRCTCGQLEILIDLPDQKPPEGRELTRDSTEIVRGSIAFSLEEIHSKIKELYNKNVFSTRQLQVVLGIVPTPNEAIKNIASPTLRKRLKKLCQLKLLVPVVQGSGRHKESTWRVP